MLTQLKLFPLAWIPLVPFEEFRPAAVEKQARRRRKTALKDNPNQLLLDLLDAPLIPQVDCDDRTGVDSDEVEAGPNAVGIGPECEERVEWKSNDIVLLHSALLEESLKALAARGNAREKLEILDWIFESDYVGEVVVMTPLGPKTTIVYNHQCPLSFAFCCKLEGHDPSVYRAFIRQHMPEVVSRYYSE